jgi:hypothetical protein
VAGHTGVNKVLFQEIQASSAGSLLLPIALSLRALHLFHPGPENKKDTFLRETPRIREQKYADRIPRYVLKFSIAAHNTSQWQNIEIAADSRSSVAGRSRAR